MHGNIDSNIQRYKSGYTDYRYHFTFPFTLIILRLTRLDEKIH